MVDDTDPKVESDLRRRAAWLLAMLAVVAVLFVVVMTVLINPGKHNDNPTGPGALDSIASTESSSPPAPTSTHPAPRHHSSTTTQQSSSSPPPSGTTSCPTQQTCVLSGDAGHGLEAINAYRVQHGAQAVPGQVSAAAQTCAVHNGNGCTGGWAETELSTPDGQEAVQKILPFAKLLDPGLKTIDVGWAYDPSAKLYYFAIIRND